MRAALQSETGLLKASFQSSERVNKVNSGGAQHIPNKTRALYTARKPHCQVKELIQSLQMWMKSWGAVNKTAPQVDEGVLWMGWQSQQRQSELFRDKRRANKLFCRRERLTGITVWEQLSMNSPTCEVNNAVITTYWISLCFSFSCGTGQQQHTECHMLHMLTCGSRRENCKGL